METDESKTMLSRFAMPVGDLYTRAWSQGDALAEIGSTDAGLLALMYWAQANRNRYPLHMIARIVERFLALPQNAQWLQKAIERQRARRADAAQARCAAAARDAKRRRAERIQQAEFDAHNRERGMLA